MMTKRIKPIVVLGMILVIGLAACEGAEAKLTPAVSSSTSAATTQPNTLATPYAQQPAAGICASFEGEMVVVTINPDIPDPRCSKVRPDQELTVINNTQNTLEVSIGRFRASLEPGAETIFDTPFGEYLEPGVHQLQVSPCCGPELWLEESK
jgi:hypothetical protein